MNTDELQVYAQRLRNRFIEGLIKFSGGAISLEEAKRLSYTHFRPTDYFPGSTIIHKGPLHNAKEYVRSRNLLCDYYKHDPNRFNKNN